MRLADDFVILDRRTTLSSSGPVISWVDGLQFNCLLENRSSIATLQAEQMGATSIFDGLAESNIPLEFHTVIKRMRDGATFRITDHPEDRKAPDIATEEMRGLMAFRAERWAIPG